jgi:hypothetical protein
MYDTRRVFAGQPAAAARGASPPPAAALSPGLEEVLKSTAFFAWLAAIVGVTMLFGQHLALPLAILVYLLVWGRYGWLVSIAYAAASLAVLVVLFDYLSPTTWYPALYPIWPGP